MRKKDQQVCNLKGFLLVKNFQKDIIKMQNWVMECQSAQKE